MQQRAQRAVELTAVILMLVGSDRGMAELPDWVICDGKSHADYVTRTLGPGVITRRLFAATRDDDALRPFMANFSTVGAQ